MSKIQNELIQVGVLLLQGVDVDTVAGIVGVPIEWVINVDLEMRGLTDDGDGYVEPYFG
jgi:hypothetical protein